MTDDVTVFFLKNPQSNLWVHWGTLRCLGAQFGKHVTFTFIPSLNPLNNPDRNVLVSILQMQTLRCGLFKWPVQVWQLVMKGPPVKLQSDGLPGLPHTVVQVEYCTTLEMPQTTVLVLWIMKLMGGDGFSTKPPALTTPALSSFLL